MKITLGEAVFKYHNHELNLQNKWFTGEEWKDGTAQAWHKSEYKRALQEKEPSWEIVDEYVDDSQSSLF